MKKPPTPMDPGLHPVGSEFPKKSQISNKLKHVSTTQHVSHNNDDRQQDCGPKFWRNNLDDNKWTPLRWINGFLKLSIFPTVRPVN